MASTSSSNVWLITGCSSGFGREITLAALARGDKVIATARNPAKLDDLKAKGAATIALDVTSSDETMAKVAADAMAIYGRIDILVNNAGCIVEGAVEECDADEVVAQFNTNVFGVLNVLRAFLPYMRAQRSGVIANIGSVAGWMSLSASGLYCASKFALVGLTDALRQEVAHLGIEVTVIEPGYFRTNFLAGGGPVIAKKQIADLEPATKPIKDFLLAVNGKQPGDPTKGSQLIVEALTKSGRCAGRALPARLALGKDAVNIVRETLEKGKQELEAWADLVSTTDCDDVAA